MTLNKAQVARIAAQMKIHGYRLRYIGTVRKTKRYQIQMKRGGVSLPRGYGMDKLPRIWCSVREISAPCLRNYFASEIPYF